jgi:hypothetical protein
MIPARTSSTTPSGRGYGMTAASSTDRRLYAGMMVSPACSSHTGSVDAGVVGGDTVARERQRASERRRVRRERMRQAARHLGWWLAWQTRPTQ